MIHADDDIPADLPTDLPPAEGDSSLEHKEFLVSDAEQSVNLEQFGEAPNGATSGEAPADAAIGGEALPDGEASNPAIAVDAMLSAEMLPEGLDSLPADPSPALQEVPTFQIQLRSLSEEARPLMKKALEAAGVSISDKAWNAAIPVLSQLTEFQAITLLQTARALGLRGEASVVMPDQVPSEDDLALGDLSSVSDAPPIVLETAPSVTLPKGEKEVLLSTPDSLPGGSVRESFGIVIAHRTIARRLFREEDLREKLHKELRSVPGRSGAALPSSHLQILLRDLMLDLRKSALSKGANSVLGVKIEAFPESGGSDPQLEQLRLVAFGTAAVVEKS